MFEAMRIPKDLMIMLRFCLGRGPVNIAESERRCRNYDVVRVEQRSLLQVNWLHQTLVERAGYSAAQRLVVGR